MYTPAIETHRVEMASAPPPPPAIPPEEWPAWLDWLIHNAFSQAFGGAFAACTVFFVLLLLIYGLSRLLCHKFCKKREDQPPSQFNSSFLGFSDREGIPRPY